MFGYEHVEMNELVGKVFSNVYSDDDSIVFETEECIYRLEHHQDCCENVYIESIVGDLRDLMETPILTSEERSYDGGPKSSGAESYTWTFYSLATIKGYVDIRFYGSSNGYYGESAYLYRYERD